MSVLPGGRLVKDIQTYIKNHPPETYEPLSLPRFTSQPIITVKSQPLPDIGLLPDLSNLNIKLIDYGEGFFESLLLFLASYRTPSPRSKRTTHG